MARSTRRSSAPSRSASTTRSAPTHNTPAVQKPQPVSTQMSQPQQPSLFAQMAATAGGVAVGSAVGHTVGAGISSLWGGSRSAEPAPVQAQAPNQMNSGVNPCEVDQKAFMRCLDSNSNDISACQFYLDMYKQCQTQQTNSSFM